MKKYIVKDVNDILDSNIDDKVISNSTIVYVRVSTVSQIDGNSLDYQQKLGIEFFENSDIKFDSIIVLREEGKSGDDYNETNFVERPLLRYINSKIDSGIINHFWIYDLSRLSRNSKLSHILFKQFKDNNVNLYVLNERKKVDDISDKFIMNMLSLFDEYENEKRFERSLFGKIESVKNDKHYGGKYPYGYEKGTNGKYKININESKIVKEIFNLFGEERYSIMDIVTHLTNKEIKPPISTVWNEQTLRNILRSEKYIGKHRYEIRMLKNESKEYCREKGKLFTHTIKLPKIISQKLFDKVQLQMLTLFGQSNRKNNTKYEYLLNGLMYCGSCGNSLKINRNKKINQKVYHCNYKEKQWKFKDSRYNVCGNGKMRQINIDIVEDLVWNEVLELYKNSHIIKTQFKNSVLPKKIEERNQPNDEVELLQRINNNKQNEIDKLNNSKIELFEQKLLLNMSEEQYNRISKTLDDKIDNYIKKISENKLKIIEITNGIDWYDWLSDFEKKYSEIKDFRSLEDKKLFINSIVKKIDVFWDSITNTHKLKLFFHYHIVNDERIRLEKYRFKVKKGKNYKVIYTKNPPKRTNGNNQFSTTKKMVSNYSTVTDLFDTTKQNSKPSITKGLEKLTIKFVLNIQTPRLSKIYHYNSYQTKLYRIIKFLIEKKKLSLKRISEILFEKGYRSVRTKSVLRSNYIHSIYKKGKVREERIGRSFKSEITNIMVLVN